MTSFLAEVSPSDKIFDDKKRLTYPITVLLREAGYAKRAERCENCGNFLGFQSLTEAVNGRQYRLTQANFCKDKFCPMCQWRKSLAWKARYWSQLPNLLADYPGSRFLFLTLTVKNPHLTDLRNTIQHMNQSFRRLSQRKDWPGIGFHKALECTLDDPIFPHPHFHILMMVRASYFGREYIKHEDWVDLWQSCLRVTYPPSVRIKTVKPWISSGEDGLKPKDLRDAIKETIKYITKTGDIEKLSPNQFETYAEQMKGLPTQTMGGVFRQYFKDHEPDDLINVDDEKVLVDAIEKAPTIWFAWNEHCRRYRKLEG